jgi:hypothetical protein
MSKPKTTTGTTTGLWSASEGDVVLFTPSKAEPVLLSKLKLDRGNGERALGFVQDSLASIMRRNRGTITSGSLDEILEDVDRYYRLIPRRLPMVRRLTLLRAARPIVTDDAITIIDIGRSSIARKNFGNARVYRLDSLSEVAVFHFPPKATINDLKIKAGKENNQAATAVLAQVEDYLHALVEPDGLAYEPNKPNTIKPLTLRINREVIDDMTEGEQTHSADFAESFKGFAAFYKSGNKCDRVIIALARNSTESLVNLHVGLHNKRVGALESRLKDLEERLIRPTGLG